jgi:hypothetical protein
MKRIISVLTVAAVMAAMLVVSAVPAFASHEHYLLTPGTCVEDVASGQTAKEPGEGGYHKLHDNVHKGQPGLVAFEKANNLVSMDKGYCPVQQ